MLKIIWRWMLNKKNIIYKNIKEHSYQRYITLYNWIEEKEGNYTDLFLFIKDKNKREEAANDILKSNLWNYFKKIKNNHEGEHKKIIDDNGNDIGYVVRVNDLNIIESYIIWNKIKEKEEDFSTKNSSSNYNPQKINFQNIKTFLTNSFNDAQKFNTNSNTNNNMNINI